MKKLSIVLFAVSLAVFLAAGSALALPYLVNDRPLEADEFYSENLQAFFDNEVTAEYDAVEDQSTASVFQSTGVGDVTSFVYSMTGDLNYGDGDQFGMYSYFTDMYIPIFDLNTITSDMFASTTVYFGDWDKDGAKDDVKVMGPAESGIMGTYLNFGPDVFGYYTSIGNEYRHTEDNKNTNSEAWALTYQGHGGTMSMPGYQTDVTFDENHWLIAFETLADTSDFNTIPLKDFDDLLVVVESVEPIPEPATMLLLGSGLIGLGTLGRKKKFSNKK